MFVYTIRQAVEITGYCERTIHRKIREKAIRAEKRGKIIYLDDSDVNAMKKRAAEYCPVALPDLSKAVDDFINNFERHYASQIRHALVTGNVDGAERALVWLATDALRLVDKHTIN